MKNILFIFLLCFSTIGCSKSVDQTDPRNMLVVDFYPTVVTAYDKAEESNLKSDEIIQGEDPDVNKCICKGTGWLPTDGGAVKLKCRYHGDRAGSSMSPKCDCGGNCTCIDCDCSDCDCKNKATSLPKLEKITMNEKPNKNTSNFLTRQIIVFTATWCGPCQMMKSEIVKPLQDIGLEVSGRIEADVRIMDIDKYPDYYNSLRGSNRTIPLVVEVENNKIMSVIPGRQTAAQMRQRYNLER